MHGDMIYGKDPGISEEFFNLAAKDSSVVFLNGMVRSWMAFLIKVELQVLCRPSLTSSSV